MKTILITGSAGLIGAQSVDFFIDKGFVVVGIDNDMRSYFFGDEASTSSVSKDLRGKYKDKYTHCNVDIRDKDEIKNIFKKYNFDLIIHAAAQPSHDWAAKDPFTDFEVNANGTLNLLENFRNYCPQAVFILSSTNKVYGDLPNSLPLVELETRWELSEDHSLYAGIKEDMPIDNSLHSL